MPIAGALILAGQLLGVSVQACEGEAHESEPACSERVDAGTAAIAGSGMRASIDPATGKLTEEPAAGGPTIASNLSAPLVAPVVRELPNGASIISTRGLLHTITATASPDGLPKTDCGVQADPDGPPEH